MTSGPQLSQRELYTRAYHDAREEFGDIGLEFRKFEQHLSAIVQRHLGDGPSTVAVAQLLRTLHTSDLYLSIGCAEPTEAAWQRFDAHFRRFLQAVAYQSCGDSGHAREICATAMTDLFWPDGTGQSRIGSFDATYSLTTWLRAVITNKVIDERRRRWNRNEPLDSFGDIVDGEGSRKLDERIRASKYGDIVDDSLKRACQSLTESESLLLLLHYDEGLRSSEIARLNAVHPSTISRRLRQIQDRLRLEVIAILERQGLSADSIDECLVEILENPRYSIISHLRAVTESKRDHVATASS